MRIPKFVTWFYPRRTWYGPEDHVYLTFDDGPHPEITPWILAYLEQENVKATFFWQGSNMEKYPELIEQAVIEGHTVGHHGYFHNANNALDFETFKKNYVRARDLSPHDLYRPPKGIISSKQAKYVMKRSELIMWSYLSYDWDHQLTVNRLLQNFEKGLGPREIAVFHENDKTTERIREIIPEVIRIVREKGLTFAPLPKK